MFIPKIPDNRLSDKIKRLTELCKKQAKEYGEDATWFKPSVSDAVIEKWEKGNNIVLPSSYKCWLNFSGKACVRNYLAYFYDISEFIFDNDIVGKDLIIIGELWGDGELLCFSKINGTMIVFDHGEAEIIEDFEEILDELIRILEGESSISEEMDDLLLSMLNESK